MAFPLVSHPQWVASFATAMAASSPDRKLIMTSAPARQRAMATALPMPEFAPVTRAFWPLRTLRTSQCGMTTDGATPSSGIMSRTREVTDISSSIVFTFNLLLGCGFDAGSTGTVSSCFLRLDRRGQFREVIRFHVLSLDGALL